MRCARAASPSISRASTRPWHKQRADARAAWSGSGEKTDDTLWFELREELGATEFLGYDTESAEGNIVAIVKDGTRVDKAGAGDTVRILTNQTPFYGESGGQVGDAGAMFSPRGGQGAVTDTEKKLGALHVHVVRITKGEFAVGDTVELRVDAERRRATRANHSATHLLHAALKRVLGPHVSQKGSLVAPERLRFDFAHPKALIDRRARPHRKPGQRRDPPELRTSPHG